MSRLASIACGLALTACSLIRAQPPDVPRSDEDCELSAQKADIAGAVVFGGAGALLILGGAGSGGQGGGAVAVIAGLAAAGIGAIYAGAGYYGSRQHDRCWKSRRVVIELDRRREARRARGEKVVEELQAAAMIGDCRRTLELAEELRASNPDIYELKVRDSFLVGWCVRRTATGQNR
ncbi:MAG: hypothetical protein JNL83_20550 [Myxococcales bacterium]|nr:hypothetical protein [Myxococcales bacterium]